jgi:glycosyltransferase involved in cell wall biosynthesis
MSRDLLCFSHLRWDFVYQRPNHLMARAARNRRVFFVEEAVIDDGPARLEKRPHDGLVVVVPHLPANLLEVEQTALLQGLIKDLVARERIEEPWLWYYTPMALEWTRHLEASAVVYDCMDELSAFRGAPRELLHLEAELLARADLVFTGGRSLYEAKAGRHSRVFAMPSAVDVAHFASARLPQADPGDQEGIGRPRIGYYGVIDERIDRDLVSAIANERPDWHLVLVGPVAKLAADEVPVGPNVHSLGMKPYDALPRYLAGWDVAIMPFAINEATRYISPTKTPEYLAGGRPVVSTPIRDVVEPYGRLELVRIADTSDAFIAAIDEALREDPTEVRARADVLLAQISWDATWARMEDLVERETTRTLEPVMLPALPRRSTPRTLPARPAAAPARAASNRATEAARAEPLARVR